MENKEKSKFGREYTFYAPVFGDQAHYCEYQDFLVTKGAIPLHHCQSKTSQTGTLNTKLVFRFRDSSIIYSSRYNCNGDIVKLIIEGDTKKTVEEICLSLEEAFPELKKEEIVVNR